MSAIAIVDSRWDTRIMLFLFFCSFERFQNNSFVDAVYIAGRLVEQGSARFRAETHGQVRYAAFRLRKGYHPSAPTRVLYPSGKSENEVVNRSELTGRLHFLFRGIGFCDAEVIFNGFVKKISYLTYHRHIIKQAIGVDDCQCQRRCMRSRRGSFARSAGASFRNVDLPHPRLTDDADDLALFGVHTNIL